MLLQILRGASENLPDKPLALRRLLNRRFKVLLIVRISEGVVSEVELLDGLNVASEPDAELVIANLRRYLLYPQLDQALEQSEVKPGTLALASLA